MANDGTWRDVEQRVRALVASGDAAGAASVAVRAFAPEILGFLTGVAGNDADADEIFAAVGERLWRSLSTFEWRCSLRTWVYVISRREAERFRRGARRHLAGRVRISEVADVIAAARSSSRSAQRADRAQKLMQLRGELSPEERELLVLRVDRGLAWGDIALAFADDPESCPEEEVKRLAARMRKRFQLVREKLAVRVREEGFSGE
jgi:RNA polymerase sigma-70 factor (ECF subfamily)